MLRLLLPNCAGFWPLNYRRLSKQAQELVDRLDAFRGPVPVEAAEWVGGIAVRLVGLSELSELTGVFKILIAKNLCES